MTDQEKSKRGFASMPREKVQEIARKGGRVAHAIGVAHEFTPEEARIAGRKGGKAVSRNKAHMREIAAKGGAASRELPRAIPDRDEDERERS